ncbi:uncharacterized protein LOC110976774 isoform X2 [Acanthaster planci]|uniref:Netrin receptor UNC5 n=1 Tax=Acanthaster planci TaxID=133434 RepID=A0A8B7Y0I9_ACAPL|nr:uncharacterized protein LOC110976774 isoform X2 [Acanthaster planci]
MADASTSSSARDDKPTQETGMTDEKHDQRVITMIVDAENHLLKGITQVNEKGVQSTDPLSQMEEFYREQRNLTAFKLRLNEYRLKVIGLEKESHSKLSEGKLEWALNRGLRQWLSLRREVLLEEQNLQVVRQGGRHAHKLSVPGLGEEKSLDALKRLKRAEASLADELMPIPRKDEGEYVSLAEKHVILFHLEQLVWYQRMWVWNLREMLEDRAPEVAAKGQEELIAEMEELVTEMHKVVSAQRELVQMERDSLGQRRETGRQLNIPDIPSKTADVKELVQLISEQIRLTEASPVHSCLGELHRTDLLMEDFACINVRWEVIFEHARTMSSRQRLLQKSVVESAEMLRQQVYALGVNHPEIYQILPQALDLEGGILLKQITFWGEVIQQYHFPLGVLHVVAQSSRTPVLESTSSMPGPSAEVVKATTTGTFDVPESYSESYPEFQTKSYSYPLELTDPTDFFASDSSSESSSSSSSSVPASPTAIESEGLPQDGLSTKRTHLQLILKEYDRLTAGLSDSEQLENVFQLSYMAIGYFDQRGGSLALVKYKVHLYIPRGAIPAGSPQKVYIYVDPSAPPIEGLHQSNIALSPMIQCGPTGLTFLDTVVLSFPHHAKAGLGSNLWALICHDDEAPSKEWQFLRLEDGILVMIRDRKAVLLLKHFCGAALAGELPVAKMMKVGAFGEPCDPQEECYPVRIHIWNDDPVAEQKVMDTEMSYGSNTKPLDVFRELEVEYVLGDVQLEIKGLTAGWEPGPSHLQTIQKKRVWRYCTNSVTFAFDRQQNCDARLRCYGHVYQDDLEESVGAENGDKVEVLIRPSHSQPAKGVAASEMSVRPGDLCSKCRKGETEDFCQTCKDKLAKAYFKKERGQMYGDYGGLSPQDVEVLCWLLEAGLEKYARLDQLIERLIGAGDSLITFRDVLKLFFASQREEKVSDQDALGLLGKEFDSMPQREAARIVREHLDSTRECVKRGASNLSDDEIIEEQRFRQLARDLGPEWEELATNLGISYKELSKIKSEYAGSVNNQIFDMLCQSRTKPTSDLIEALRDVERRDLAEQLEEQLNST